MSSIEKIRQEIERLENMDYPCDTSEQATGFYNALDCLSDFIDSLPEEKATCKTCGFYENNCPFIRGKLIPYPNKVCKDYTYSAMKEQEKPSEDLEEAADNHIRKVVDAAGHPGWDWITQDIADAFIAGAEWQKKQDATHRK